MSHITKVQTAIKDLDALGKAAPMLKMELRPEQKTYISYAGQRRACDAALAQLDEDGNQVGYEVGLKYDQKSASYRVECDFWSTGGLTERIGADASKLKEHYNAQVAKKALVKQGYRVSITVNQQTHKLRLRATA